MDQSKIRIAITIKIRIGLVCHVVVVSISGILLQGTQYQKAPND